MLPHVFHVASGVSQWVHLRSSWLYGARDAPQTKGDALDFALLVTTNVRNSCVIIAVATRRVLHILKRRAINALVWDVHKCFTYVPHVNHWDLRDVD